MSEKLAKDGQIAKYELGIVQYYQIEAQEWLAEVKRR